MRWVVLILATALTLACARRDRAPDVLTVELKKTRFRRAVEAEGHLVPVRATPVTAPSDADMPLRIVWLAPDGTRLKKGDLVARFDDLEIKSRVANAEDDLRVAATKKTREVTTIDSGRRDRERTAASAERELELTRSFARKDEQIFSRDQIIEAELDERLQTAKSQHARQSLGVDRQLARRRLQIITVEASKAHAAIERNHKSLATLEARAPHDGVLVLKRNWRGEVVRVGDTVWRSDTVAEVPAMEALEAEVFVLEADAAGLAPGKTAELRLAAHGGRVAAATVARVDTVAKRRQWRSPTQYFGVTLTLKEALPAGAKPGQRVSASIVIDERDALVLPRPALAERDGRFVVYRREASGFSPVPVKIGAATPGLVTIDEGLAVGDVVALRDPARSAADLLGAGGPGAGAAR